MKPPPRRRIQARKNPAKPSAAKGYARMTAIGWLVPTSCGARRGRVQRERWQDSPALPPPIARYRATDRRVAHWTGPEPARASSRILHCVRVALRRGFPVPQIRPADRMTSTGCHWRLAILLRATQRPLAFFRVGPTRRERNARRNVWRGDNGWPVRTAISGAAMLKCSKSV
jgi:hypothetical protein